MRLPAPASIALAAVGSTRGRSARGAILPWALALASCASGSTRGEHGGPYPLAIPPPAALNSESDCVPPDPRPTICPESLPEQGPEPIDTVVREMRQAYEMGEHCRALRLAERAGQMGMRPSLRAFIAREQQLVGLLVEAGRSAAQCVRETEADASLRLRREPLETCRRIVRETGESEGASVIVRGPATLSRGLRVFVAGEWRDAALNAAYPTPAGAVSVAAFVQGVLCCRREVNLARGDQLELEVRGSGAGSACGRWRIELSNAAR
jgi:hypothetical protein